MWQKINNWFIKQRFYWNYLIKNRGVPFTLISRNLTFNSITFKDGQWNEFLPWAFNDKKQHDPNTYHDTRQSEKAGFWQRYGEFKFLCMLNGEGTDDQHSAIWLLEIRDEDDVNPNLLGFSGTNYYYEIDIELFSKHFGYTIHVNHNGRKGDKYTGYHRVGALFGSKVLMQELQNGYHLHTIDWGWDYIRYYIDGLLTAKFKNEIHLPMQIILSKLGMSTVIVTK
jgi:hypothetical protein